MWIILLKNLYVTTIWGLMSSILENSWVLFLWIAILLYFFSYHVLELYYICWELLYPPCILTFSYFLCCILSSFLIFIFIFHLTFQSFCLVFCSALSLIFFFFTDYIFISRLHIWFFLTFFIPPYFGHKISIPAVNFWTRST